MTTNLEKLNELIAESFQKALASPEVQSANAQSFPAVGFCQIGTLSIMSEIENQTYNEGLNAQTNGAGKDANPHLPGSALRECWEMGWQQGADEDYEKDMNRE